MEALRISKVVEKDGEIRVTGLPYHRGENVEMIFMTDRKNARAAKRPLRASDLRKSSLVGVWRDRADIGDVGTFSRKLRENGQNRRIDA